MPLTFLARTILTFALLTTLVAALSSAQHSQQDSILGKWTAENQNLKMEMFRSGQEYKARLLWGNRVVEKDGVTFKLDTQNPDPALRTRSLEGIEFITGLVWETGSYTGGSLYDGSSGRSYRCKAEIKNGKLVMRGYMGMSMFGQTMTFIRTNESEKKASD